MQQSPISEVSKTFILNTHASDWEASHIYVSHHSNQNYPKKSKNKRPLKYICCKSSALSVAKKVTPTNYSWVCAETCVLLVISNHRHYKMHRKSCVNQQGNILKRLGTFYKRVLLNYWNLLHRSLKHQLVVGRLGKLCKSLFKQLCKALLKDLLEARLGTICNRNLTNQRLLVLRLIHWICSEKID